MQTLYFDVAECPTGTLDAAARHRLDGDATTGTLFGATLIAAAGEAVRGEPAEGEEEGPVVGYNFNAGHVDANCAATFSNATALFAKAAQDLGDGSSADESVVYALVKPLIKPRRFSIMYIEFALADAGVDIEAFWSWLETIQVKPGITAKRSWDRANDLSEDFEGFDTYFAVAKDRLGLTDAQAERILEKCIAK